MSYLAFFSFFLYGFSLQRFNHYLVWPRLAACLLALIVVFEIARDRRTAAAVGVFALLALSLAGGLALLVFGPKIALEARGFSQALIIGVALLLGQGYLHQVSLIRKAGSTGAVSWWMHFLTTTKDLSTMSFAVAMGLAAGWPLLFMCAISVAAKAAILWHFTWAKHSTLALARREAVRCEK